jgi:Mrp family chromosome partitioning ATPase
MPAFRSTSSEGLEIAPRNEGLEIAVDGEELVVVTQPESLLAEQFRRMRNAIQALNRDGAARSVMFTSAVDGEGKTVAILNLALAMVERPHLRVVVIDADREHASIEPYLGLPLRKGATELVEGRITLDQAIRPTSVERLDIIGAGGELSSTAVDVDRVHAVLNALKRRYDYVLLDAPPVMRKFGPTQRSTGGANSPSLLATVTDGIVFVVRMGETPKPVVEEAYRMLVNLGGNVLGTCATGVPVD